MLRVIITIDYEIHGNGEGAPQALMVEPTDRMLDLFERCGAKLTIMADVAEILRFQQHAAETGEDRFGVAVIVEQLRRATARGHDVQLHLHPGYVRAAWDGARWRQEYSEYDLARLDYGRVLNLIRLGKAFLEETLRPVRPGYVCTVFRAGNWAMQPSRDVVTALIAAGFAIDTSVFKDGRRSGLVSFDYGSAWSDIVPWPVSTGDICALDPAGQLIEVPIYAESRWVGAFFSTLRLRRVLMSRRHPVGEEVATPVAGRRWNRVAWLFQRHAWKMDINQCDSRQLIGGLRRAEAKAAVVHRTLPLVLIGHSKLFSRDNERRLEPFLEFVQQRPDRFQFGTFGDLDLNEIREAAQL